MRNHYLLGLALFVAACSVNDDTGSAQSALIVSPDLVIANVYGGGGNTGATFNQDFVVLFNRGTDDAELNGQSIFYASPTGTFVGTATSSIALSGRLLAGDSYLIGIGTASATVGTALPTPDLLAPSMNLGSTAGKVALASTFSVIATNGCTTTCDPSGWTDLVGWGTATLSEGTKAATTSNTTALSRGALGCTDTGNNSTDFTVAAVVAPRNSATAATPCTPVDFAGDDLEEAVDLTPPIHDLSGKQDLSTSGDDGGVEDLAVAGDLSATAGDGSTFSFPDLSEAILPPTHPGSGGCTMSSAATPGALAGWLVLAAAIVVVTRRRRA